MEPCTRNESLRISTTGVICRPKQQRAASAPATGIAEPFAADSDLVATRGYYICRLQRAHRRRHVVGPLRCDSVYSSPLSV